MAEAKPAGKSSKSRKPTDTRTVPDKLVDAALDLAATHRWRDISLPQIAAAAGVPIGAALATHPSRLHILRALSERVDADVLGSLEKDPLDGDTKDQLFDLLMRRFDALDGRQEAMRSIATGLSRDPLTAACLGSRFLKSMALTLQAAGIDAEGCQGMIKAKVLGAIQLAAFRTWLKDTEPGLAQTMSTLDKGLRRAEQLAGRAMPGTRKAPESA